MPVQVEGEKFIPTFFSDGVMMLSGHSREEYKMIRNNVLDIIYEPDRRGVFAAFKAAVISRDVLDVSYRMRHKDGSLIWIHLNGGAWGRYRKMPGSTRYLRECPPKPGSFKALPMRRQMASM
ncbi:MAG: PAS domain-containing protein [[Clostridium] scindens]